jgi:hypothetical protein
MIPNDVLKWTPFQWKQNIRYMKPSGGGAQGVVFVWDQTTTMGNRTNPATSSFVIKPIQGTGAATKFAEFVLKRAGGASSPNSKPIARNSPVGDALVMKFKEAERLETDQGIKARWTEVMAHYEGADSFLLQETQQGIQEFGDVSREGGLRGMLRNEVLMKNLGMLFAADAIIGNGDRLCQPNTGNIVFKMDGTLSAIDSSTVLTNYNAILNDTSAASHFFAGPADSKPTNWANDLLRGGGLSVPSAKQQQAHALGKAPVLPPGFGMKILFDVDTWWTRTFRSHLENGLRVESQRSGVPMAVPRPDEWAGALLAFKAGVDEGIRKADSLLSGFSWLGVKSKYNKYVSTYGGDPNLDWTNLKIRRVYFKARKRGKSDVEAMTAVTEYVKKKFPGI